ncbi:hypothetical protein B0A55_07484 [Friedmanniomyces simplex]|uniref:GID complex catalytic subunit 2 n=1 Tax=Friedmanniomyces simplex TaxID=329884 RepID=A0A4U0X8M3_9PEZI|nr:hypothetical protein B0A55_07484 [Friedmanniomyces simplex]
MDALLTAHTTLTAHANLSTTLTTVDSLINLLQQTRDSLAAAADQPSTNTLPPPLQIAKLKAPVKQAFEKVEKDLKEVNKGLNGYQKALKEKFKGKDGAGMGGLEGGGEGLGGGSVGTGMGAGGGSAGGGLAGQKGLVERAIAMHLLREGQFDVASTFIKEVSAQAESRDLDGMEEDRSWLEDFATETDDVDMNGEHSDDGYEDGELYGPEVIERGYLQRKFAEMYRILDALRNQHNLAPAIHWANTHSAELGARASDLEFELARLRFVELYTSPNPDPQNSDYLDSGFEAPISALHYARTTFPRFHPRYTREISALLGALAFSPGLSESPYRAMFEQPSWETVANLFTTSYTTLLSLPSQPPLLTTTNAGTLALPSLTKFTQILTKTRSSWTTSHELPVETPLPASMIFHNIFVCPVSKEQGTEENWPVMLPCGHVLAKESLEAHARGKGRCKCPYCPVEFRVEGGGKRVFI